jgi:hypothetical protein
MNETVKTDRKNPHSPKVPTNRHNPNFPDPFATTIDQRK